MTRILPDVGGVEIVGRTACGLTLFVREEPVNTFVPE